MARYQVFISYSHCDREWLERLQVHLKPLVREGAITLWDDTHIKAGARWREEIEAALNRAKVAILLVSADFLASDFITDKELPTLLAAAKQETAVILPVIVSPSQFERTQLVDFQAVNSPEQPLIAMTRAEQEAVLVQLSEAVQDAIGPQQIDEDRAPGQPWNVPLEKLSRFFTGREALLSHVHETLSTIGRIALTGMGGIGKTQAALAYANAHRDDYEAGLWVLAASREDLISGFVALAGVLNLPERNDQEQGLAVSAVRRWLETHAGWLLILDNADDLQLLSDFLPKSGQGKLLLTTRDSASAELAQPLSVEKLDSTLGALFLLHRAGLTGSDAPLENATVADHGHAQKLATVLDGLPLALDQAGAFLEANHLSPAEYLELYRQEGQVLREARGGLSPDHPSVTVTFALAFERTAAASPAAAELLRLCAFLHPAGIPEELFSVERAELGEVLDEALGKPLGLIATRRAACQLSLMARDRQAQMLTMHLVVQAVLKDGMDEATERKWAERAVRLVSRSYPDASFSTWAQCERQLAQAFAGATLIKHWRFAFDEAAALLENTGKYLNHRGPFDKAEPLFQRALVIREDNLGPEHPDVAETLNDLAKLYLKQGPYSEAEALFQRALAIREDDLGPEHPDVAETLNDLAELYLNQGRNSEAEPLYQRALAIREDNLGPKHPDVAETLNDLALLYSNQGRYCEAEPLYQRALMIAEQALGPEHWHMATALNNMALLYFHQGRYSEAEPLYQRALAIREKALEPGHPHVEQSFCNLADLFLTQGRYKEAELLIQRAQAVLEEAPGPE